MEGLFDGCEALKVLPDISKWNTNKVKTMKNMFRYCSSLIRIPDVVAVCC